MGRAGWEQAEAERGDGVLREELPVKMRAGSQGPDYCTYYTTVLGARAYEVACRIQTQRLTVAACLMPCVGRWQCRRS